MSNSANSSSSDEDENMLREALDNSMFNIKSEKKSLKSLLFVKKNVDNHFKNILNVTPEFQNFVAKLLTNLLDKNIEEYHCEIHHDEFCESSGIKLFKNSKRILSDQTFYDPFYESRDFNNENVKKKKLRKKTYPVEDNSGSDTELLKNAKLVAVSPEWVLNKEETASWCKPKGVEIKYKKNTEGILEIVNPPFIPTITKRYFILN